MFSKFVPNKIIAWNDKDPTWMNEKIKYKVELKNQLYEVYINNSKNEVDFLIFKNYIAELKLGSHWTRFCGVSRKTTVLRLTFPIS